MNMKRRKIGRSGILLFSMFGIGCSDRTDPPAPYVMGDHPSEMLHRRKSHSTPFQEIPSEIDVFFPPPKPVLGETFAHFKAPEKKPIFMGRKSAHPGAETAAVSFEHASPEVDFDPDLQAPKGAETSLPQTAAQTPPVLSSEAPAVLESSSKSHTLAKDQKKAPSPLSRSTLSSQPAARFAWPVRGSLIKTFGSSESKSLSDGINIAVPEGTPVKACTAGEVAYVGTDVKNYGQLILIKHRDGWVSSYGHNQKILVKPGDQVTQGQTVAFAGATGSVRTPQVHFELRKNTVAVDPCAYLE